jgi:hypothetical protein
MRRLTVNLASRTDCGDCHRCRRVINVVDDSVISRPDAPTVPALQFFAALRSCIVGKSKQLRFKLLEKGEGIASRLFCALRTKITL